MKDLKLLFEIVAIASGLYAAWFWYKASKVEIIPTWAKYNQIEPPNDNGISWIVGILEAAQTSGKLNKTAALWTAGSLILSAVSSVIDAWLV